MLRVQHLIACLATSILTIGLGVSGWSQVEIDQLPREPSVRPDVNAPFLDANLDPDEWIERFETESREIFRSRDAIVKAVGLSPGDRVVDIGAGTGLFTMLFAEEVGPYGWVFAVDIAPAFVERIGRFADQRGLANVSPVLGSAATVRLPPESVDVAYVCDTYHHFEFPQSMLGSIRQALRPEGRLVIVDFERVPGVSREWVLDHVRAGKPVVRREIETSGFDYVSETDVDGLEENYFITFRKKEQ
jgi:predicted methyltransferase